MSRRGHRLRVKSAFLIQGDDRLGTVADSLGKLADQKISVVAVVACTD